MNVNRVEFDSTLDEIADVNMRLAGHTTTYRQQRLRSQWFVGGCLAVTLVVTVLLRAEQPTVAVLGIALGAGLAGGVLFAYLYGHFHDWYVRHTYRRMVREMFRGVDKVRCEFELRQDVLWTKARDVEVSFPWSRLTRVNDAHGSIELWFDPGLAVVRDRAFGTEEDRRRFLEAARNLVPKSAV